MSAENAPRARLERLPGNGKSPANTALFGERLKGFEPSTFCMASRPFASRPAAARRKPGIYPEITGFPDRNRTEPGASRALGIGEGGHC